MPRPSYRSAHAELREARMALSYGWLRCPQCNKPTPDMDALKRHIDVNHPKFPPNDDGGE